MSAKNSAEADAAKYNPVPVDRDCNKGCLCVDRDKHFLYQVNCFKVLWSIRSNYLIYYGIYK